MPKQVILYTQPGWGSCEQEKEFLSRKGVAYTAKDIRADVAAREELIKLGFRATPVTIIDGEAVVGFDRGKLERLLGLAWSAPFCRRMETLAATVARRRNVRERRRRVAVAFCKGWGQDIAIPAGIESGDRFDCPNWAGLTLRASVRDSTWLVREVKKASCAVGEETIILPDDVKPGDIIECHGVKQQVTYEFGAYALARID